MSGTGTPAAAEPHAVLRQAAAWYATLQAGDATDAQRADWRRWLDADPAHTAAWRKIEAVSSRFGTLPAQPALEVLKTPSARRSAAKKVLGLAAIAACGGIASRRESRDILAALRADERTAVGEIRKLALDDGSDLWMNTDSALDIDPSPALQRLVLYRGEIMLHGTRRIAPVARSLVVDVPDGRLSASGAHFSVQREEKASSVTVFEGAVRLDLTAIGTTQLVHSGTRMRFGPHGIGAVEPADVFGAAWIRKRLSVDRMRLDDFVAILARYRHGRLGCDPAVADLLLTGSYPLDDVERILAALEQTLPLRVRRILPWWIVLEPLAASV